MIHDIRLQELQSRYHPFRSVCERVMFHSFLSAGLCMVFACVHCVFPIMLFELCVSMTRCFFGEFPLSETGGLREKEKRLASLVHLHWRSPAFQTGMDGRGHLRCPCS